MHVNLFIFLIMISLFVVIATSAIYSCTSCKKNFASKSYAKPKSENHKSGHKCTRGAPATPATPAKKVKLEKKAEEKDGKVVIFFTHENI